jgi:hypothetical protein
MASTMVMPKDSSWDDTAAMEPLAHSVSMGERGPIIRARPFNPRSSITCWR